MLDAPDGEGIVAKAKDDEKKRVTVTLTSVKGPDGLARMLPAWVVLHAKTGANLFKKLHVPDGMQVRFNENAYWNKSINLEYLKWLREELNKQGHGEVLCVFDSFTGQICEECLDWMKKKQALDSNNSR